MISAGWPTSADHDAHGGDQASRHLGTFLPDLAIEFPSYEFSTQQTWDGVSLVAICRDGAVQPGTYVVITSDPGEMRHALASEDDQTPRG